MLVVVADTSPLNYLVLIGAIEVLPRLFDKILVPTQVLDERRHSDAPQIVQAWVETRPDWLHVQTIDPGEDAKQLDEGERAAIALAQSQSADLMIMDDRPAVAAARMSGLEVIGTIGVLDLAARKGLIDLKLAFARLKQTNFRYPPGLLDNLTTLRREG